MKGMLQTFEAMLGILMIFTVFVIVYGTQEIIPDVEMVSFKTRSLDALKAVDDRNLLRPNALANETSAIEKKVSDNLPANFNYRVIVCDQACADPGIDSDSVTSVSYYMAGDIDDFRPRRIVLYVW